MSDQTKPVVVGIGELLWDMLPAGRQPGGAPANFAFHAGQLGADSRLVTQVGDDPYGCELAAHIERLGLDTSLVTRDPNHPTGTVTVDLDAEGVPTFTIHEDVAWDYLAGSSALDRLARKCSVICYGTLASRSPAARETIRDFLDHTSPDCLRVFDINIRQEFYTAGLINDLLHLATVLKLNDAELPLLARLLGIGGDTRAVLVTLLDRYELRLVAFTRGASGSLLVTPDNLDDHSGFPATIADTVGAGDAFTATLTLGLLRGMPLHAINDAANRVAAFVCSQPGGTPVLPDDLAGLIAGNG